MSGEATACGGREKLIDAKIEQLLACHGNYELLHEDSDRRRQAWWEEVGHSLHLTGSLPRQAYALFLLHYLRLRPDEVPVVYEDERKIVWRSFNFCPLLDACGRLGLDTREVCRRSAEQAVQNLIARLDARLRFSRDYANGIRPYAGFCEETIELMG